MRGYLCGEILDFLEGRFGLGPEQLGRPPCARSACPGTRHAREWAELAADRAGVPVDEVLRLFGEALFPRLARRFPAFLVGVGSTPELVQRFETHVAAEVRKLDATLEPPRLALVDACGDAPAVLYQSSANLAALAFGLLRGSARHFEEELEVERCDDPPGEAGGATFRLRRRARGATYEGGDALEGHRPVLAARAVGRGG